MVCAARRTGRRTVTAMTAAALLLVAGAAQARWYVYQKPDGSRVLSDHELGNAALLLVRESDSLRGMGGLLARRGPVRRFRSRPYDRLIRRNAAAAHVSVALVKAVVHAESGFDPSAVSPKGASGLMQLMPATAERYGVRNVFDPAQNVAAGVHYLKDLLVEFNDNHRLALAAYNAGVGTVLRYGGVPPYSETRTYVRRVMRYRSRYLREAPGRH